MIPKTKKPSRHLTRIARLRLRGRDFSPAEITLIRRLVKKHFKQGRTFASVEICKALEWKQPNGWLKERACRDVLRTLESMGQLKLPKSRQLPSRKATEASRETAVAIDTSPISRLDFKSLGFLQVKGKREERVWNSLVRQYHYLGFKVFVGRYLKYFVYAQERIIAAFGVCDSSWSVAARDIPLRKCGLSLEGIRSGTINNGRFLIMPWVRVDNLASFILSAAIRHVARDWRAYYAVEPILLETFVEGGKFKGTCYKAANWLYVGETKGYKKSGCLHQNSQPSKMVFLYPLTQSLRLALLTQLRDPANDVSHRPTDR